ncbi:hypothetical protein B9Q03_13690 [Candidatus Marsarchaeota G2 archaeon OSP_D]|uniref:Uncharacterized protein n=1 Tax=Candidatus Marsarchaeota G2 archaeon OSP_D TaxID=1978157 RepID=A0A2R6A9F7_9ARCH|nr:MAG: hypothetical protein B9Q03_13690 [Candidatus Marsarchaeota G2 archaeon OSP_D]
MEPSTPTAHPPLRSEESAWVSVRATLEEPPRFLNPSKRFTNNPVSSRVSTLSRSAGLDIKK